MPQTPTTDPRSRQPIPAIRDTSNMKVYIGCSENFKLRYANHKVSFSNEARKADTELSKYVWEIKQRGYNYDIKWKILRKTSKYNKRTNTCNLCTTEKLEICNFKAKTSLLNKRNELVSKCRHANKHLLINFRKEQR